MRPSLTSSASISCAYALANLCNENAEVLAAAMSSDFKTASQEKSLRDRMAPVGTAAFAKLVR